LPLFKMGPELAARKSTLVRHIEQVERKALKASS
jgi:hypothetical protein